MWVVPSRGRPDRCQELLVSIIAVGYATPGIVITDGEPTGHIKGREVVLIDSLAQRSVTPLPS